MANLVLHGERELHSLAISAAPCGHCRQFYSELACAVSRAGVQLLRQPAATMLFWKQDVQPDCCTCSDSMQAAECLTTNMKAAGCSSLWCTTQALAGGKIVLVPLYHI